MQTRERLLTPRRKAFEKPGALSGLQRLIKQCGVTPLMYRYGETQTDARERRPIKPIGYP